MAGKQSQKKSKDTQVTVKVKAYRHTATGKLIELLNSHPRGKVAVAWETIEARFLPFVLDPEDERSRETALECALMLKGYLEKIQLQWDLPELLPMPAEQGVGLNGDRAEAAEVAGDKQEADEPDQNDRGSQEREIPPEIQERDQEQEDVFG